MTEKDLRKLNRKQLLELLLVQTEQNEQLRRKLAETEKKLNDRAITASEAGSIAEASMKLNGVFAAAEAAAEQYLHNIREMAGGAECKADGETLSALEKKYEAKLAEVRESCRIKVEEAENAANEKIKKLSKVLRLMYAEKQLLDSIFEDINVE